MVMNATASAEAILAAYQVTITLPDDWQDGGVGPNLHYYTDGTARLYVYGGDRAYFAYQWGIPEDVTDLDEATDALADYALGDVIESDLDNVGQVAVEAAGDYEGLLYLIPQEDTWMILSGSAPTDEFETYRADVFDPAVLSVQAGEPEPLPVTPTLPPPAMLETAATEVIATPTAANPMMLTQTQVLFDLTMTVTSYVTPTASATLTFTPTPTFTPSPEFGATATARIVEVTASAEALAALPSTGFL